MKNQIFIFLINYGPVVQWFKWNCQKRRFHELKNAALALSPFGLYQKDNFMLTKKGRGCGWTILAFAPQIQIPPGPSILYFYLLDNYKFIVT